MSFSLRLGVVVVVEMSMIIALLLQDHRTIRGVRRIGLTRLKPPPLNPPKKIIYSFKSGAFYVSQFVHPVAHYVPPIQLIN